MKSWSTKVTVALALGWAIALPSASVMAQAELDVEKISEEGGATVAQAGEASLDESGQEPAADGADDRAPSRGIEEITVTARKREESLQSTPVAVTAFTETDLKDQDVRDLQEITASVPTLQFDNAVGNANSARIYLRGVGNGDPISSDDPGVGIYVDGVFLPRAQGALLTVSDVRQVEVLRGPQGTLFGKNTIGGAVSVTTKKPDPTEFFGDASVRVGNLGRFDTRLALNVPLIPEMAAARFSFATATRDPFVSNKSTGRDFQDEKLLAGRAQFLVLPTDNLEVNFSVDRSIENNAPGGGKCKVTNTLTRPSTNPAANRLPGTPGVGEFAIGPITRDTAALDANSNGFLDFREADANGDGIITSAPSASAFGSVVELPVAEQFARIATGAPAASSQLLQACAEDDARDERSVVSDLTSSKNNLETWGVSTTITYELDNATLKSISSWRRNENVTRIDNDYTALDFAQSSRDAGDGTQDAFSQELQLVGSAMDGKLNYVVGLYGFKEDVDEQAFGGLSTTSRFLFGQSLRFDVDGGGDASTFIDDFVAANGQAAFLSMFPQARVELDAMGNNLCAAIGQTCISVPGAVTNNVLKVNNLGYAAYTQGTYDFSERLSLTLGARLTSERKRVSSKIFAETEGFIGGKVRREGELDFGFERSERFKDISPLATLSYQLQDDTLVYTTYSKGFKSGGFNGRANSPVLTGNIDDEKLTSYEIGFKSSFFDNRLLVNGAAFWSIYEDIQLTIPMGIDGQASIAVLNAGEAEIKGGELEARALLLPNLELSFGLGVVNSRYTDFDDPMSSFAKDRRLLATPNYTGNVAASYLLPVGDMGDVRVRTEWTHRGASGTDVVDSDVLRKGKNGELDATLTWAMADGVTEILLFGNNLLNREYFTNGVNLDGSLGIAYRFFNTPRTYGIEVRRAF